MKQLSRSLAYTAALGLGLAALSGTAYALTQVGANSKPAETQIVFENDHLCRYQGDWQECGRGEIAVIRPNGTGFRRLTHNKVSERGPVWSQDHHWIAFGRETQPLWTVWVMDANGRHLRNVSRGLPPLRSDLDLSPHGGRLVVSAAGQTTPFHLYLVDVRTRKANRLTNLPGEFGETMPVWSPDGRQIAFWSNFEIWTITLSSGEVRQLTFMDPTNGPGYPAWSPDGRRIAFDGAASGIWIMNADGSDAHPVPQAAGQNPTWSADGRWIVFSPYPQNGLRAVHPDGSGLHWIRKERAGWIDPLPDG